MASLSAYSQFYVGSNIYNNISRKNLPHSGLYQFNIGYSMRIKNLAVDCTPFQISTLIDKEKTKSEIGWAVMLRYYLGKNKNKK